jgi:hypothetical protein
MSDAFITKYLPDGTKAWTKLSNILGNDSFLALSSSSDGSIYASGFKNSSRDEINNSGGNDVYLIKYLSDGTKSWTQSIGTIFTDEAYAVTTDAYGSIYVCGRTNGNLDGQVNNGDYDSFIIKYQADGVKIWTKLLGASTTDEAYAIAVSKDGSIFVSGRTDGNLDGQTNNGGVGGYDAFITKYLPDGTKSWTKLLGSINRDEAYAIAVGADGSVYVAGNTNGKLDGQFNNGGYDGFVAKYLPDGTKAWTKLVGTSSKDEAFALSIGLDGAVFVSGNTAGNLDGQINAGENDAFIVKFLPDGTKSWTKLLGSDHYEFPKALATGADGDLYISGWTYGNLDGQINGSTGSDTFLSKYSIAPIGRSKAISTQQATQPMISSPIS